jgi:hypothetical protein
MSDAQSGSTLWGAKLASCPQLAELGAHLGLAPPPTGIAVVRRNRSDQVEEDGSAEGGSHDDLARAPLRSGLAVRLADLRRALPRRRRPRFDGLQGDANDNAVAESFFASPEKDRSAAARSRPARKRGLPSSTTSRPSTTRSGSTRPSATSRRASTRK